MARSMALRNKMRYNPTGKTKAASKESMGGLAAYISKQKISNKKKG